MATSFNTISRAFNQQDYETVARLGQELLLSDANNLAVANMTAVSLYSINQKQAAIGLLEKTVSTNPDHDTYTNLLKICVEEKAYAKVIMLVEAATNNGLESSLLKYYLGKGFQGLDKFRKAYELFDELWEKNKDYDAGIESAICLERTNELELAESRYQELLAHDDSPLANNNIANLLVRTGNSDKALQHYEVAFQKENTNIDVIYNYALTAYQLMKLDIANVVLQRGLSIAPDYIPFNVLLASIYFYANDEEKGYQFLFEKLTFTLEDDLNYIVLFIFFAMRINEWTHIDKALDLLNSGELSTTIEHCFFEHLTVLFVSRSRPIAQWLARYASKHYSLPDEVLFKHNPKDYQGNKKIRLGYISSDFHNHCVGFLLGDLLKNHDRSKFTVTAFYTDEREDKYTDVIKQSVDEFIPLHNLSFNEGAKKLHHNIDILIDLTGFTGSANYNYFSKKPCPLQLHMLGDLPPFSTNMIDYAVVSSDIPNEDLQYYDEKIIQLKTTTFAISPQSQPAKLSKQELGLPEDKLILACLGLSFRLTPNVLRCWLDVLKEHEETILWLFVLTDEKRMRLKKFANEYNGTGDRLYFTAPILISESGVISHVDIYMNTEVLSCFTSVILALDALIPVVSLRGNSTFSAGGATHLKRLSCDELIAENFTEYKLILNRLISDKAFYTQCKTKLKENVPKVLHNQKAFINELEQAYEQMWTLFLQGKGPEHIKL